MKILLTNDDGIQSEGLRILADACLELGHEVFVVAPSFQQSAVSQGITVHNPFKITQNHDNFSDVFCYHVDGKPADTVKVAIEFLNLKPDLVISGVNNGPNLGTDILYSGTVGAATEASIYSIPAIAISTDFHNFEMARNELKSLLAFIIKEKMYKAGLVLNINFPAKAFKKSKGIVIARQGVRFFAASFRQEEDKHWFEGEFVDVENAEDSDVFKFYQGYTTITPIDLDRLNVDHFNYLSQKFNN